MLKYWGKQIVRHGSFPEVGQKKKKVGENNGQLRFVRHHGWRMKARLDQNVLDNSIPELFTENVSSLLKVP